MHIVHATLVDMQRTGPVDLTAIGLNPATTLFTEELDTERELFCEGDGTASAGVGTMPVLPVDVTAQLEDMQPFLPPHDALPPDVITRTPAPTSAGSYRSFAGGYNPFQVARIYPLYGSCPVNTCGSADSPPLETEQLNT